MPVALINKIVTSWVPKFTHTQVSILNTLLVNKEMSLTKTVIEYGPCKHPYLKDCDCNVAMYLYKCSICNFEFKQKGDARECILCPYLRPWSRSSKLHPNSAQKVTIRVTSQEHDGYCSDHGELREAAATYETVQVPIDVQVPVGFTFTEQDQNHCCCGAMRTIEVLTVTKKD